MNLPLSLINPVLKRVFGSDCGIGFPVDVDVDGLPPGTGGLYVSRTKLNRKSLDTCIVFSLSLYVLPPLTWSPI